LEGTLQPQPDTQSPGCQGLKSNITSPIAATAVGTTTWGVLDLPYKTIQNCPIIYDFARNEVLARVIKVKREVARPHRSVMKTRSPKKIPDSQLQQLVRRLLRTNQPDTDTPVIISPMEGEYFSSVGRLLERTHGRVSVLVDHALERERAVTVFLPENAYVAEVMKCTAQGEQFSVELELIQYQDTAAV